MITSLLYLASLAYTPDLDPDGDEKPLIDYAELYPERGYVGIILERKTAANPTIQLHGETDPVWQWNDFPPTYNPYLWRAVYIPPGRAGNNDPKHENVWTRIGIVDRSGFPDGRRYKTVLAGIDYIQSIRIEVASIRFDAEVHDKQASTLPVNAGRNLYVALNWSTFQGQIELLDAIRDPDTGMEMFVDQDAQLSPEEEAELQAARARASLT